MSMEKACSFATHIMSESTIVASRCAMKRDVFPRQASFSEFIMFWRGIQFVENFQQNKIFLLPQSERQVMK